MFDQDLSKWDVSKVKTMGRMFEKASSFNQDISNWDVSNVFNMFGMFEYTSSFDQNLSPWKVRKGTNFTNMFHAIKKFDSKNVPNACYTQYGIDSEPVEIESSLSELMIHSLNQHKIENALAMALASGILEQTKKYIYRHLVDETLTGKIDIDLYLKLTQELEKAINALV